MNSINDVELADIIIIRESMLSGEAFPETQYCKDVRWDYLTLYNQGGEIIMRSYGHRNDVNITLLYRGIQFFATPGYGRNNCFANWQTLVNYVNK